MDRNTPDKPNSFFTKKTFWLAYEIPSTLVIYLTDRAETDSLTALRTRGRLSVRFGFFRVG